TLARIEAQKEKVSTAYEAFKLREAISETMNLARIGNKYFTDTEPWKTRKTDPEACGNTLHVCLQITAALSMLFDPVLPHKMTSLRKELNLAGDLRWDDIGETLLEGGSRIEQGKILFTKIEDEQVEEQLQKLKERSVESPPEEQYEP